MQVWQLWKHLVESVAQLQSQTLPHQDHLQLAWLLRDLCCVCDLLASLQHICIEAFEQQLAPRKTTYYWFDIFVMNQHSEHDLHSEQLMENLRAAVRAPGRVLLALDSWREPTPLARAALGALAQLLRALRRFGLAAPAAVRQACAGIGGAPAVAAACADALRHSDDARWPLAHLNVANSVLASEGGLACAEASGLAPALARALAGGRGLSAHARAKCAAALARKGMSRSSSSAGSTTCSPRSACSWWGRGCRASR